MAQAAAGYADRRYTRHPCIHERMLRMRPRVSVFLALSLDGFIAGDNGDLSWLEPFSSDSPDDTGYTALMNDIDVIVMGRNTYDTVINFDPWPYAGKRMVVMTRRELASRHGEEPFDGTLAALLEQLAKQGHRHVYLDGGLTVREGLKAGVVDRITLSWVPIVLGTGIPLFGADLPQTVLRLDDTKRLPSGLMQAMYVPVTQE
ncbi:MULTISPECIES: dihydrofolate reductase family protein [Burkholderia]|nr:MULTISPECIES: dihydrofolate reductase family protein [Burkholderia]MDP9543919.1 dihydrofolate reductase [Burkholderia cepacia]MDO5917724.1 dihydrofolate reductase family protein [Burkholderia cenocepacia]MDP9593910.1 dihydrofolate reductase [Burkholderia cepacia]MDP9621508.1 dihydrofolate reductase [Burkholderia cepacia]MDP9667572.1 dihydrofolate reductase [Burkholderia cepacia]